MISSGQMMMMSTSTGPGSGLGASGPLLNIRRDVKDPFYRYKMPPIRSKIEGKGNGIKTVIVNCVDVSRALARPPAHVCKYFGGELGTIVHCDDKNARYIVNGAHEAEKLQSILDGFISRFVLCGACENPETDLIVSAKSQTVSKQCKACGQRSGVDMGHRLVPFILKNPPPRPSKLKKSEAPTEVGTMDEKKEMEVVGMAGPDASEFTRLQGADAEDEEEDDWAEEEAEKLRRAELEGLSDAVRQSLKLVVDPLDEFADWLEGNKHASDQDIQREVAQRPELEPKMAIVVVVQTLFDCDDGLQVFQQRLPLLQALVAGGEDLEEQMTFLYSLERLVGKHRRAFLTKLPALLQNAYQSEIVDEDALLQWNAKPSKRFATKEIAAEVRAIAKPFIDWLNQSEGDDAEDE